MDNLNQSGNKMAGYTFIGLLEDGSTVNLIVNDKGDMVPIDDELDDIEAGQSRSIWPYVMGRYD